MLSKNTKIQYFTSPLVRHSLFWLFVFLYFILSVNIANYEGYIQLIESSLVVIVLQIITAYTCIYWLIPNYLNKKKPFIFTVLIVVLMILMFIGYNLFKMYYYDPKYFESYGEGSKAYAQESLLKRLTYFHVILGKSIKFLTPTALILMFRFYKERQHFLTLSEQKKTAELSALKHQLNPHFLFNTLNNLYALALKKSDQTPEVVEKLSDILDYMLYRCNDQFVSIHKEIELIENYLALEKIRYGNRVQIDFENNIKTEVKIAPLILLTFIENAFKHGVSQELKQAEIHIKISLIDNQIYFYIRNSKSIAMVSQDDKNPIGLNNVKKQLELIYGDYYELTMNDQKEHFTVQLKIEAK